MAKKSKKPSEKVNDVSKPGETPASSNARPTITGHSPVIKIDPMVAFSSSKNQSEDEDNKEGQTKKKPYAAKSKTKISPISEDMKDDEKDNESDDNEKNTNKTDKPKETEEKTSPVGSESAAIDAIAQTADVKKAESKEAEEEQKHKDYISELIKSGKYRLPIIEGGHKGSAERLVSWIFLLLLLASVITYLAIDAEYIDIGFNVPFEFIKN